MLQSAGASRQASIVTPEQGFWNAPIPALLVRADGCIMGSNAAAERMLGRTSTELGCRSVADLIDSRERPDFELALATAALDVEHGRSGRPWTIVGHDGFETTATIHFGPAGEGSSVVQLVPVQDSPRSGGREQQAFRLALLELSELSHDQNDDLAFYTTLVERAIDVVPGAQAGSIMIRRPGTDEFDFVAAIGFDLAGLQQRRLRTHEMFRDITDPSASINRDLSTDDLDPEQARWMTEIGRLHEIATNVSAPVMTGGEAIAFISLDNFDDRHAFDATSVEMTTLLGRLIADLLRRRDLEAQLRSERESFKHLAHHDELTGLANRRHLESELARTVARARATHEPVAVLFVDLDDFKQLNDELGHDVGDEALVAVAQALRASMRTNDLVGRWGGDEFLVVAPNASGPDDARSIAERIMSHFDTDLQLSDGTVVSCGMSIGVAWTPDGSGGVDALVHRADEALYEAKKAGKSAIHVADR